MVTFQPGGASTTLYEQHPPIRSGFGGASDTKCASDAMTRAAAWAAEVTAAAGEGEGDGDGDDETLGAAVWLVPGDGVPPPHAAMAKSPAVSPPAILSRA
jgi:hypothetical protein